MSNSLEGRWFPGLLILSAVGHGAACFLTGAEEITRPDFSVEERVATEPMTVRIIQPDPEPVAPRTVDLLRPILTSDEGRRSVDSLEVEPPERVPLPEPEPLPEPVPEPILLPEPVPEPPPEPPPEPVKEPEPVAPPPKETPIPTGPKEQESQSGVAARAKPRARGNRPPVYPRRARAAKMEGTTQLEVTVDAQGKVQRAVVSESSGHSLLDDEALKAVKRWRFTPAKSQSGASTNDRIFVPITFRLTGR